MTASDLMAKLQSGFGKAISLAGLQSIFAEMPFDLDDVIGGLDDIEDGSSLDTPE